MPPWSQSLSHLYPEAPWYNEEIIQAKKEKRMPENTWQKSSLTVHRKYVQKKENVNPLIQSFKETYYSDMITESSD